MDSRLLTIDGQFIVALQAISQVQEIGISHVDEAVFVIEPGISAGHSCRCLCAPSLIRSAKVVFTKNVIPQINEIHSFVHEILSEMIFAIMSFSEEILAAVCSAWFSSKSTVFFKFAQMKIIFDSTATLASSSQELE